MKGLEQFGFKRDTDLLHILTPPPLLYERLLRLISDDDDRIHLYKIF